MMNNNKVKNNLIIGIGCQIITLILGILVPKTLLDNYGSEVNGLLTSVTNIYAYIAIVEAGVAAAACQALYKSTALGDRTQTNAIMSAAHRYYRRTGFIYLCLIVAFAAIYPVFVRTEIACSTVILVILFNGLGNVVNYFFHGKYLILLKADGKNYVRIALETLTNAAKQGVKIILISAGWDIVSVQFIAMLISFLQMLYVAYYINKHYSWINLQEKPDFGAISQSKHVFVHEINYLITSNIDVVLLTIFNSLKLVSVYSLYALLFGMINRVLRTLRDALEFKIAHAFHRDREAFLKLFEVYEVYYITFAFALFTIVNYFIFPFLKLYTGGITDINYIQEYLPTAFVLVNLLSVGRYPSDAMVHISGHFQQTKNSAMIETIINLIVSVALVQRHGIIGTLLGTIVSSLYRTNYLILYINKKVIGRSVRGPYKCWCINFAMYCLIAYLNRFIVPELNTYVQIIAFCVPYSIGVLALYFIMISMCTPAVFQYALGVAKKVAKR